MSPQSANPANCVAEVAKNALCLQQIVALNDLDHHVVTDMARHCIHPSGVLDRCWLRVAVDPQFVLVVVREHGGHLDRFHINPQHHFSVVEVKLVAAKQLQPNEAQCGAAHNRLCTEIGFCNVDGTHKRAFVDLQPHNHHAIEKATIAKEAIKVETYIGTKTHATNTANTSFPKSIPYLCISGLCEENDAFAI